MKKIIQTIVSLAVIASTTGCAALMSRGYTPADSRPNADREKVTPIFAGVVSDVGGMGCAVHCAFVPPELGTYRPILSLVAIPLYIVDIPLSGVADILFLPHDIYVWPDRYKKDTP